MIYKNLWSKFEIKKLSENIMLPLDEHAIVLDFEASWQIKSAKMANILTNTPTLSLEVLMDCFDDNKVLITNLK